MSLTPSHGGGQLLADNADQHLAGLQRTHDLLAQGLVLDTRDEVAHDRQGHVGLQQGHSDLAQHVRNVCFGNAGLASHFFDEAG